MSGLFGSAASSNSNPTQGDLSKDVPVANPPEDSISALRFSPASDHLSVASWDKKVRIYEIDAQGQGKGVAMFEHEGPVLDTCWSNVGITRAENIGSLTDGCYRMDKRYSPSALTRQRACWTLVLARHQEEHKSPHTINPSSV